MPRTILVPLDGSPLAEGALPYAVMLANASGAKLLLLHATRAPDAPGVVAGQGELRGVCQAAGYLAGIAARLDGRVRAETSVVYGEPANAIVEESMLRGVELVVMASHGRSGPGWLAHGSVAQAVLARSPVPVLLVRAGREREAA